MAFRSILAFGTLLAFAAPSFAHMQMAYPYPINSQHDPQTPENLKDYSYTAPLNADGSNYPCKGYQKTAPFRSTATFSAGGQYNMTLMGSATHGGGSCQISLSYDNGETFKVIQSFIGGCPLTPQLDFTIPTFAPAGQALLSWSWLNYEGNRELYQNCARVEIAGFASSKRQLNSAKFRRQASTSSMDDLPDIYRANLASQTDYQTPPNSNTVYPNPGPSVKYSDDMTSSSPPATGGNDGPTSSSGISGSSDSGSSDPSSDPSSSQGDSNMTLTIAAASATTSSCTSTITSYSTWTVTVSGTSTYSAMPSSTTTFSATSVPTDISDSTTSVTIATAPTVTAASTAMPTATSSTSNSGTFSAANAGACPDGAMGTLKCTNGGQGFSMCNWGQWVDMGSVAAGTECTGPDGSGQIVAADSPDSGYGSGSTTTSSTAPANGGYGDSDAGSSSGGYSNASSGSDANSESETAAPGSCDGAPMGSLKCLSSQDWAMCNWGTWVDMGSVAAGMQCQGADGSAALVSA